MNRAVIILIFGVIIGISVATFMIIVAVTGSAVNNFENKYTYTRALCSGNKCTDYYIECSNGNVTGIRPISGLVVFPENWTDDRENVSDFCNR
jgi:hypothetical protein